MKTPAFNKYVWLIELLKSPHTLEDIGKAWSRCSQNYLGKELSRSTFYYWKTVMEKIYGVKVLTTTMGRNAAYVIESAPGQDKSRDWLLDTASVENTLLSNLDIRDRIILEKVPSSGQNLQDVLNAIHQCRCISFDYHDYWEDSRSVTVQPYFVKQFRQHWKVIGPLENGKSETIRSYALDADRMTHLKISDNSFHYPDNFDPESFMEYSFGTMTYPSGESHPKTIIILAWEKINLYLKAVPLHESQVVLHDVEEDGYTIFEYKLYPSDGFYQELCKYQEYIEVLSPPDVREEMKGIIKRMQEEYDGVSRASCVSREKPFEEYLGSGQL